MMHKWRLERKRKKINVVSWREVNPDDEEDDDDDDDDDDDVSSLSSWNLKHAPVWIWSH